MIGSFKANSAPDVTTWKENHHNNNNKNEKGTIYSKTRVRFPYFFTVGCVLYKCLTDPLSSNQVQFKLLHSLPGRSFSSSYYPSWALLSIKKQNYITGSGNAQKEERASWCRMFYYHYYYIEAYQVIIQHKTSLVKHQIKLNRNL